jgi:transposase
MSNGATRLMVSPIVRHELERWVRDPNMPRKLVLRARIVLGAADGLSNSELARQLETSRPTVIHWRRRFAVAPEGVELLRPHPGRKKTLTAEKIETIVSATLQSTPPNGIRWSTRALARAQRVSHSSVFRIWKDRDLQIHLLETFRVRGIAALYVNSVDAVAVFIGDNNCQIQARDDTHSVLPVGPRVFVRISHDTGTQSQLEGLRVSQVLRKVVGKVGSDEPQQRLSRFLTFLDQLHGNREVQVVALNTGLLAHPSIQEWFSSHARYRVHYVRVGSGFYFASVWAGMVERWLTEICREGRSRRTARNVRDLLDAIGDFVGEDDRKSSFMWWAPPLGRFQGSRSNGWPPEITLDLIAAFKELLAKGRAR